MDTTEGMDTEPFVGNHSKDEGSSTSVAAVPAEADCKGRDSLIPSPDDHGSIGVLQWFLFFAVGLYPWLVVNGVFAELAVLNSELPEGKALSSQAGAACQLANVGLVYVVLRRYFPKALSLTRSVWFLLALSLCTFVLLTLFWDVTVGGHSVVVLGATFLGGVVGIVSIVVLYPWAAQFPPAATSAVSSGTASSGILGGVLGLAQGAGNDHHHRFSAEAYLAMLAAVTLVSGLAFWSLDRMTGAENEYTVGDVEEAGSETERLSEPLCGVEGGKMDPGAPTRARALSNLSELSDLATRPRSLSDARAVQPQWRRVLAQATMPMCAQLFNCLFNYSFLPGMIPYLVCGHGLTFWLTEAYSISNVFGRWLSTFYSDSNVDRALPYLTGLMGALFGGGLFLAHLEDKGGLGAEIVIGCGVVVFSALNGYIESLVFLVPSRTVDPDLRELSLQIVGMIGQVGAFVGTFVTAALVATGQFQKC